MIYSVITIDSAAKRKEISLDEAKVMLDQQAKKDKAIYKNDPKEWFNYYKQFMKEGTMFFDGWLQFDLQRIPETYAEQMKESGEYILDADYWNEPY